MQGMSSSKDWIANQPINCVVGSTGSRWSYAIPVMVLYNHLISTPWSHHHPQHLLPHPIHRTPTTSSSPPSSHQQKHRRPRPHLNDVHLAREGVRDTSLARLLCEAKHVPGLIEINHVSLSKITSTLSLIKPLISYLIVYLTPGRQLPFDEKHFWEVKAEQKRQRINPCTRSTVSAPCLLTFLVGFRSTPKLAATSPLPSIRDVGYPKSMSMDLWRTCGLRAGRKHKGRPMVWETREVRKEVSHCWFASLYLSFLLTTNIENTFRHAAASTSLVCKMSRRPFWCCSPPPPSSHARACQRWIFLAFRRRSYLHLPCVQVQSRYFDAVRASSTSLICKSEPENFYRISMPFAPLPPSHAKAS